MICFSGPMYWVCRYWQPGSPLLPRNKNRRTVRGLSDLYQLGEIITLRLFKLNCKKLKPCQRREACLPRLFSGWNPVVEATCRSGNRAALLLVPGWWVRREAPPGLPLWPSLQPSQQENHTVLVGWNQQENRVHSAWESRLERRRKVKASEEGRL